MSTPTCHGMPNTLPPTPFGATTVPPSATKSPHNPSHKRKKIKRSRNCPGLDDTHPTGPYCGAPSAIVSQHGRNIHDLAIQHTCLQIPPDPTRI
eukprot:scaffold9798_cov28-Attheya_sp.AAC.1